MQISSLLKSFQKQNVNKKLIKNIFVLYNTTKKKQKQKKNAKTKTIILYNIFIRYPQSFQNN